MLYVVVVGRFLLFPTVKELGKSGKIDQVRDKNETGFH